MISAGRVLLMPKGAYDPSTTYEMLDIVSYNGSSYVAKGTTTGNLPTNTTYWQLSAYGGQASNVAGNFAELEITSVASMTHYVDDIFVDENSQLMKATQTINIGDTIDVNTNCTPTTVEALLISLSARMDSLDSVNRKIQGAIEIAAQTDLHSLALGEYYKKQTSFYVTNAPTGIDQDPTAVFRLTIEAALDNASQASSPLLLTLRTPDGKIFTQGYDGTTWKSWEEIANENSVATKQNIIDNTLQTTSKTVPGAINELNSKNQTLTNKLSDEVETRASLGAHNLMPFDLAYVKSKNTGGSWSNNVYTHNGVTFTCNLDSKGNLASIGVAANPSTGTGVLYLHRDLENILESGKNYILNGVSGSGTTYKIGLSQKGFCENGDFPFTAKFTITGVSCWIQVESGQTVNTTIYPMIRDAKDTDPTYQPYAMTNRELTEKIHAIKTANYISKSADSSKTWATLINEAVTALNSLLATLGSGEYLTIQRVLINGDHVNIPNDYMMNTNTFNRYGSELMIKADRLQAAEVHLASSGSYFHRTDIISSGGTLTYNYTDTGAQVPISGAVRIDYVIFN